MHATKKLVKIYLKPLPQNYLRVKYKARIPAWYLSGYFTLSLP